MSRWIEVAEQSSLPRVGEACVVKIEDRLVALFVLEDGVFALDDTCSHESASLSEGEIVDDEVYCPKHGSRFDIRSGAVRGLPALKPVTAYPTKVTGGKVYLEWKG